MRSLTISEKVSIHRKHWGILKYSNCNFCFYDCEEMNVHIKKKPTTNACSCCQNYVHIIQNDCIHVEKNDLFQEKVI